MTPKECYEIIGGSYEEAIKRLMNDALISKFLIKFLNDKSFENLCSAIENKDYAQAFREAHTLKGVSQNMSFTALSKAVIKLTDELRPQKYTENVLPYFEETKKCYLLVKETILNFRSSAQ